MNTGMRRQTPQRSVILAELATSEGHLTAAEIFARVRRHLPRISLGTVYRNLDVLAAEGRLVKLAGAGPEARYDGTPTPHDHVRCRCCNKVADVPSQDFPVPAAVPAGFVVECRRLEYVGVCASCSPEANAAERKPDFRTESAPPAGVAGSPLNFTRR